MRTFETEEFFREFEFSQPFMLSASDCESVSLGELLELGGGSTDALGQVQLNYAEAAGSPELRAEVAAQIPTVFSDDIVVLGSPVEGILLTLQALGGGGRVVVLSPAYDALRNMTEHVGAELVGWWLRDEGDRWSLDLDALDRLVTPETSLLVCNFPHNPTGFQPTREQFEQVVDVARRNDVWLFSDERYRGLEYEASARLPSAIELYQKAIVLQGVSKCLGLPGLRFGWLACRDEAVRDRILNDKHYTSMCGPQPIEYLGRIALSAAESLLERNRRRIELNLSHAQRFFESHTDAFRWIPPMAGSVSMAETIGRPAEAFCRQLASRHGVVLLPGRFMGAEDRYVRFGYGRRDFAACLEELDLALRAPR